MAELIGVAGGAIGVAGFAIQVAETILKIKGFYKDFQELPVELQQAKSDLDRTYDVCVKVDQSIKRHGSKPSSSNQTILDDALRECNFSLTDLATWLADTHTKTSKQPLRGTFKAVLEKETLAKKVKRIEQHTNSLFFVYSMWQDDLREEEYRQLSDMVSHISQENQRLLDMTSYISPTVLETNQIVRQLEITNSHVSPAIFQTNQVVRQLENTIVVSHHNTKAQSSRKQKAKVYQIGLQKLSWLLGCAYEFTFYQSTRGWYTLLRPYKVVQDGDPLLTACMFGDLSTVRALFVSGQVSALDRDTNGSTALHLSFSALGTKAEAVDVVKLLLQKDADSYVRDNHNRTAIDLFLTKRNSQDQPYDEAPVPRIHELVALLNLEDYAREDEEHFELIAANVWWGSPLLTIAKQYMTPPWPTRSLEDRLRCLATGYFGLNEWNSREDYQRALGLNLMDPAIWDVEKRATQRLLTRVMAAYGYALGKEMWNRVEEWRLVLREAVGAGVDLTENCLQPCRQYGTTPIAEFLLGYCNNACPQGARHQHKSSECCKISCRNAIRGLVLELQYDGLNNEPDISAIFRAIGNTTFHAVCRKRRYPKNMSFEARDLCDGLLPQDWFVQPTEESIGEDHAEFAIPGAWVEDPEYMSLPLHPYQRLWSIN